jgi:hypothetical protein
MSRRATPEVTVRLAGNDEGKTVGDLARIAGFYVEGWDIDWSDIHPHWLLAEHEGRVVGAVQICYGKPVARLEMLALVPELPKRVRAAVIMELTAVAEQTMIQYGAQAGSSMISFSMPEFKKFVKRNGGVTVDSGNIFLKRLR